MTFQESETLSGGDRVTLFDCSLGRFGLGICYDLRFPEPAMIAGRLGAGCIIYPGAFNTTTGPVSWELLLRARATDNQVYPSAAALRAPVGRLLMASLGKRMGGGRARRRTLHGVTRASSDHWETLRPSWARRRIRCSSHSTRKRSGRRGRTSPLARRESSTCIRMSHAAEEQMQCGYK